MTSQPEPTTQLLQLARQIHAWQLETGLSDAALCRKIPQIGSSKTYKKILAGDFTQLDLEKQLSNYESAVAYMLAVNVELPPEPEYDTFSNIQESRIAVAGAMIEPTIARMIVIEGENGTGKDAVKNDLLKRYPGVAVSVEANELWKDRNDPMGARSLVLTDLLKALNPIRRAKKKSGEESRTTISRLPRGGGPKLDLVIQELNKTKTLLIINEAHHIGPAGLNIIKTLINATQPTEENPDAVAMVPVLECIPQLIRKLVHNHYEEAIQLFGNRLYQRIILKSPPADEISELFEKRGIKFEGPFGGAVAQVLAGEAAQFGNWRHVNQVARECWKTTGGSRERLPLTQRQFDHCRSTVMSRRIEQKKNDQI